MSSPRSKNEPYVTSILKENLIHFAGNSHLTILPGEAELILIGEYLSDEEVHEMMRDPVSRDISTAVGDTPVSDNLRIAEIDSYRGSYLALTFTGSMADGTRRILRDGAIRSSNTGSGNVMSFVKLVSDTEILHDSFFTGVNESPLSAYRNARNLPTVSTSSLVPRDLAMKVGGIPIYSGSMFRGNAAYKRKPQIGVSAKFSGFSYGQFTDMIQGVENTKTYTVSSPSAAHFEHGPVKVRFFSGSSPIDATLTESINLSPTSIVDTPYFDIESTGSLGGLIVTL